VFVDLGNAFRHVVHDVIDRVVKRHCLQRLCGEQTLELPANRLVHSVVVIDVEKATLAKVAPQHRQVPFGKADVSVSGHVEVWVAPQIRIVERDDLLPLCRAQVGPFTNGLQQVGETGRIGVPVSTTLVVEPTDCQNRA